MTMTKKNERSTAVTKDERLAAEIEADSRRLAANGYWVGDYGDFLGLTDAERRAIELSLAVRDEVRRLREEKQLTQAQVAKLIGTSQARFAKIEQAAPGVTLDALFRAFFALGGQLKDLVEHGPPKDPSRRVTRVRKSAS
jgi:hypothetical protein